MHLTLTLLCMYHGPSQSKVPEPRDKSASTVDAADDRDNPVVHPIDVNITSGAGLDLLLAAIGKKKHGFETEFIRKLYAGAASDRVRLHRHHGYIVKCVDSISCGKNPQQPAGA